MNTIRIPTLLLLGAALALAPAGLLRADQTTSQATPSDPSKPVTLRIRVWHGDVSVHGYDGKDVVVKADSEAAGPTPRKDGMRVLSASSGYTLTEKDNVVTLEYRPDVQGGGSADFDISVPKSTTVVVANSAHGDFECTGVTGDIDVKTMGGDVKLGQVCGGALVETMNGDIDVNVKELTQSRPLSFTSMHGEVTLHVPADAKACVRFRTHRGVILTNFDDKVLVTKTEITRHKTHSEAKAHAADGSGAPDAAKADSGGTPETHAMAQTAARPESDDDWRSDVRDSIREATEEAADAAREAAEAAREGVEAAREGVAEARYQFEMTDSNGPVPPVPPLPPMTGGKTVSGTLNGGGVEIQAATLNGDIVLKKAE
jgi:hypothetical protein